VITIDDEELRTDITIEDDAKFRGLARNMHVRVNATRSLVLRITRARSPAKSSMHACTCVS
jgi:hypothetical protein